MSPEAAAEFLRSRGWIRTGSSQIKGPQTVTWWQRFSVEFPQHFALDLERLGWTRIIGL